MAGLAVRARPSVRPVRGAFGAGRSAGRAGERARCQGAARSSAGIPPARGRWPSGRHTTRPADRLRASRAQRSSGERAEHKGAPRLPAGIPPVRAQGRAGRSLGHRAVRARPSRTGPSRVRGPEPSSGRDARAGHDGRRVFRPLARRDGREARRPPAGPAAGLPCGRSNLPHRERAENQRRRLAHPGVPPARAPTVPVPGSDPDADPGPGHRAPAPEHQRCRSTGAAGCRYAEVGSLYVCRERPPRLDRL